MLKQMGFPHPGPLPVGDGATLRGVRSGAGQVWLEPLRYAAATKSDC
jgi:hypothetical protein